MKLGDFKTGQIVVDQYGNEYKVVTVDYDDKYSPVELVCTKFVTNSRVDYVFEFKCVGDKFWISGLNDDYDKSEFNPYVTIGSLKLKADLYDEIEKLKKRIEYLENLICSDYK